MRRKMMESAINERRKKQLEEKNSLLLDDLKKDN